VEGDYVEGAEGAEGGDGMEEYDGEDIACCRAREGRTPKTAKMKSGGAEKLGQNRMPWIPMHINLSSRSVDLIQALLYFVLTIFIAFCVVPILTCTII
jgi:hypothetical protein